MGQLTGTFVPLPPGKPEIFTAVIPIDNADIIRIQAGPDGVRAAIKGAAEMDGKSCKISIPQDPGQAGKSQSIDLVRMLSGWSIKASPETGDKVTRADPFAAQVNVGNVQILNAEWNQNLKAEMRMFPNGKHDDQIDALSRAFDSLHSGNDGILEYYKRKSAKI
jgi:predicted phage terminase large subunit-like protein